MRRAKPRIVERFGSLFRRQRAIGDEIDSQPARFGIAHQIFEIVSQQWLATRKRKEGNLCIVFEYIDDLFDIIGDNIFAIEAPTSPIASRITKTTSVITSISDGNFAQYRQFIVIECIGYACGVMCFIRHGKGDIAEEFVDLQTTRVVEPWEIFGSVAILQPL